MTCESCKHFHRRPTDPMNLAAPVVGQCREQLHVILVPTASGPAEKTLYPTIPANFHACGRYTPRLEVIQ